MGHIEFEEPFAKFRAHGLLIKEGKKMSKSKGNVVNPDEFIEKFGADTVRTYLMFLGPFSEGGDWSDKGIIGVYRFLNRIWVQAQKPKLNPPAGGQNQKLETLRHRTIKKVTEDLENLHYNTAIAALMEFSNEMQTFEKVQKEDIKNLLIMLAPFAPYITEELWQRLGNAGSVHDQPWPKYDAKKIQQERVKLVLQVNGKVRDVIEVDAALGESETKRLILQNEKVQNYLAGKEPKKIIFVPGRLVNVVI
ncbi:MAG: hypothetical protein A2843_01450 [Candidatus Wildermuthbacteria bacterium RIFCSPHIGHO2_01_FULL_48_27b]|nr:MAG: hypothetical protein A2843_01450 [Candidatus Wildermuthbacteria bacterium RIFCSPHIGHO2_01_FULL_48_27b]